MSAKWQKHQETLNCWKNWQKETSETCGQQKLYITKQCFTDFYTGTEKHKNNLIWILASHGDNEGIALSAVIEWLKDSVVACLDDNKIPVYAQKDIVDMYREKLREHGATDYTQFRQFIVLV